MVFALATLTGTLAQTPKPPQYKGKSYVDSTGQYYQQAALPTYVYVSASPDEMCRPAWPQMRNPP